MFNKSSGIQIPESSPNKLFSNPLCDDEDFISL